MTAKQTLFTSCDLRLATCNLQIHKQLCPIVSLTLCRPAARPWAMSGQLWLCSFSNHILSSTSPFELRSAHLLQSHATLQLTADTTVPTS